MSHISGRVLESLCFDENRPWIRDRILPRGKWAQNQIANSRRIPIADIIPSLRERLQRVGLRHPTISVGFIFGSSGFNWRLRPKADLNIPDFPPKLS